MGVYITNRTNQVLTFATTKHKASRTSMGQPITLEWIHRGQSMDRHQHEDEVYVTVAAGEHSTPVGMVSDLLLVGDGPYLNTTSLLLVEGGRKIVDWKAINHKYVLDSGSLAGGGGPPDPALAEGLAVTAVIFSALSTALSATGPVGAVPAGLFSFMSSMMLFAEEEPPQPPELNEIEQAVERIVERVLEEQFQKHDARQAAIRFLGAQDWLLRQERSFQSVRKGGPKASDGQGREEWAQDFVKELTGWASPSSEFKQTMDVVRSSPEIAKWIIPAFLAGIAAYLEIQRLYALEKSSRVGISATTITDFQAEVDMCRRALVATSNAWHSYCDGILRKESIYGTPEGREVTKALTLAYAGTDQIGPVVVPPDAPTMVAQPDPTPVGRALWSLELAHNYLAEDLAAMKDDKPPRHFGKVPQTPATR